MSAIIESIRNSSAEISKKQNNDFAYWSKLKHTKEDFENFLNNNIADIVFSTSNGKESTITCTSHTIIPKLLEAVDKKDMMKIAKLHSKGMYTKDQKSVFTYDLVEKKTKTIPLINWAIVDFVTITPELIVKMVEAAKAILGK